MKKEKKDVSLTATVVNGAALLALWIASWALSGVDLGGWSIAIAIGIAAVKAALVVLVFMELVVEPRSVRVAFVTGAAMVAIMISFMVLDVRTRWTPPLEAQGAVRVQPR